MKHLSLSLFVGYLLFISGKSILKPVTSQEVFVLSFLFLIFLGEKAIKMLYRLENKKLLLKNKELEAQIEANKPQFQDEEVAALQKENEIAALRLRKFMTEQEYSKREIAKAVEKKVGEGGLRF